MLTNGIITATQTAKRHTFPERFPFFLTDSITCLLSISWQCLFLALLPHGIASSLHGIAHGIASPVASRSVFLLLHERQNVIPYLNNFLSSSLTLLYVSFQFRGIVSSWHCFLVALLFTFKHLPFLPGQHNRQGIPPQAQTPNGIITITRTGKHIQQSMWSYCTCNFTGWKSAVGVQVHEYSTLTCCHFLKPCATILCTSALMCPVPPWGLLLYSSCNFKVLFDNYVLFSISNKCLLILELFLKLPILENTLYHTTVTSNEHNCTYDTYHFLLTSTITTIYCMQW